MVRRSHRRERGQILPIFAMALIAMIAMIGLVIDGGGAFAQRRAQQNAADLAALAAADALYNGRTQAQAIAVAQSVAASNTYPDNSTTGVSVAVTFPGNRVQVDVGAPHSNFFVGLLGMPTWHVDVTAAAIAGTPDTAYGAAPILMPSNNFGPDGQPLPQYTQAQCGTGCVWGDDGHTGDAPTAPNGYSWTMYGLNVNTASVRDYMEEIGFLHGVPGCSESSPTVVTYGPNDYIGQQNNGNHNGAFNSADCIVGLDLPIPIVGPPAPGHATCNDGSHTNGCFYGWAMFHVTAFTKHGNDSTWEGWFLDSSNGGGLHYPWLSITDCSGPTCPTLGKPTLKLVN